MKKNFYSIKQKALCLLGLILFINGKAQSYSFSPGKIYIAVVDTSQLNYNGIEVQNTGPTNLNFTWELLSKDTLIDSEFDLCNSGICFNNLPYNGVMPTILPGQIGYLKMHMFSGRTLGINTVKYVLKNALLSTVDTLTFIINVGNPTGLKPLDNNNVKSFTYPNPSQDFATIKFSKQMPLEVGLKLVDLSGKVVYYNCAQKVLNQEIRIDITDFISGYYYIHIETNDLLLKDKLIISK
jgi:hypothetical protein